jgi:hypothetical protein
MRIKRWHSFVGGAVVAAALMGAVGLSLGSARVGKPDLAITAFDATLVDGRVGAEASVRNTTETRLEGAAWWLLSLVDGSDAWVGRVYQSRSQPVDLKAGEAVQLAWAETPAIPAGRYRLSAWVHVTDPAGASHHSDTRDLGSGVVELAGSPHIERVSAQTGHLAIADASPAVLPGFPTSAEVAISLANSADTDRSVALKADFVATDAGDPRWWSLKPTATLAFTQELGRTGIIPSDVRGTVLLPPGDYAIAVSVSDLEGNTDRVFLADSAFSVPDYDSSTLRTALPDGPLMITAIATSEHWESRQDAITTIEVRNLADRDVTGVLWWLLGDPGDPEPWQRASATSYRLRRPLGPGEARTVRLAVDGELPAGDYELSVWAHTVENDQSRHSDGVRFPPVITVGDLNREDG